ncbi:MAG: rhomboid family intramembrane serine protease [Terrimicrobiaceae bacterium]
MTWQRWWFKAVPVLVAINTVIFLYERLIGLQGRSRLFESYALTQSGLAEGRWWQLITHAFLHGSLLHLLVNMAGLWFAGRIIERLMGTGRFLVLYGVAAVAGGLAQILLTGGNNPLIGASGAVCGVVIAFTTMFPEAQIVALLFFVIPIRLRAKYLGWGITGSSLLFLVTGFEPWIGHAAHFGGCVAGYVFARLAGYGTPTFLERKFLRKDTYGAAG